MTTGDDSNPVTVYVPLCGLIGSSVAGFIAYQCIDAGGGVVATISVFEDKAGAEELTQKAADWVRENLASLVSNPPEITAGEVKLHKMA